MSEEELDGSMGTVSTPVLDIAYEAAGPAGGPSAVLLHGFPYDVRCYDDVVPVLVEAGMRVVVPYLRGFGPTRYRSADVMRSGQQGALGQDLLDLLDALRSNVPSWAASTGAAGLPVSRLLSRPSGSSAW